MKHLLLFVAALCMAVSMFGQKIEVTGSRKAVRTSGDVGAVLLPVAGLTAILINKDWEGLKQGAFAGITTLGVTYALKYAVKKSVRTAATCIHFPPCTRLYHSPPLRSSSAGTDGMGNPSLCRINLRGMEPRVRKET